MILYTKTPLSDPELKQLRALFQQPGMESVIRFLVDEAAACSCDAGNKLVECVDGNEDANSEDANKKAEQAAFYRKMIDVLRDMSRKDFTWSKVQLSAKPSEQ